MRLIKYYLAGLLCITTFKASPSPEVFDLEKPLSSIPYFATLLRRGLSDGSTFMDSIVARPRESYSGAIEPTWGEDLNFGATRWRWKTEKERIKLEVGVVDFKNQIVRLRVSLTSYDKKQVRQLHLAKRKPFIISDDGIVYDFTHRSGLQWLQSEVDTALGSAGKRLQTDNVTSSVAFLLDPLNVLRFGYSCGLTGNKEKGGVAIGEVRSKGTLDDLRLILRSPNPTSRIFAAQSLIEANALTSADRETIERMLSLKPVVEECGGCLSSPKLPGEILFANLLLENQRRIEALNLTESELQQESEKFIENYFSKRCPECRAELG